MLGSIAKIFIGTSNDRFIKKSQKLIPPIRDRAQEIFAAANKRSDDHDTEKRNKVIAEFTNELKKKSQSEWTESSTIEAIALFCAICLILKEEGDWDMIPFDVQILGAISMINGDIAQMQTGEGKTLTATIALFALCLKFGKTHLVTANSYLAKRDAQLASRIMEIAGIQVGCIQPEMEPAERSAEYKKSIVYGTASEFGFDYLRDRGTSTKREDIVQRELNCIVIDEIDSVLIDEAQTPMCISGVGQDLSTVYKTIDRPVSAAIKKHKMECDQIAKAIDSLWEKEEKVKAASEACRLKMADPQNNTLRKLMLNSDFRQTFESEWKSLQNDRNRKFKMQQQELLPFWFEENSKTAMIGERGRKLICPQHPDALVIDNDEEKIQQIIENDGLNEKQKSQQITEIRIKIQQKINSIQIVSQLVKAYCLFRNGIEYIEQDGAIILVDENTGRPMPGRRLEEGLHQAIEAKEGVEIQPESHNLAIITVQNFFRSREFICGMTGTAETDATEFKEIYGMDVNIIPTNKPNQRIDNNDICFKNIRSKNNAIVEKIIEENKKGRPILVGTTSVEESEVISQLLKQSSIPHNLLNAKEHEKEAVIISTAGKKNSVTVATNMAGRGTDIKLDDEVIKLGGLLVIGTSRNHSRRIDRQLMGRCARQGDPGETLFFVSFEDELLRLFCDGAIGKLLTGNDDRPIDFKFISKTIEKTQKKVENINSSSRRNMIKYDDVISNQRDIIYELRSKMVNGEDPGEQLRDIVINCIEDKLSNMTTANGVIQYAKITDWLNQFRSPKNKLTTSEVEKSKSASALAMLFMKRYEDHGQMRDNKKEYEREMLLYCIDFRWRQHLKHMENIQSSSQFAALAQKDPIAEFKQQAYRAFRKMTEAISEDIMMNLRPAEEFEQK